MTKTDTEILAEYGIDLYKTDDHFNGQLLQAMQDFASQESKRAVSEFKEKLKEAVLYEINSNTSSHLLSRSRINDLIDKL